jgi:hypothetical protein
VRAATRASRISGRSRGDGAIVHSRKSVRATSAVTPPAEPTPAAVSNMLVKQTGHMVDLLA